jgi:hypothetical protein
MRGPIILFLIVAALIAGLIALSRTAKEVPTRTIETDVAVPASR